MDAASSDPLPRSTEPASTPAVLPFEELFMASPLATSLTRLSDGCMLAVNDAWVELTGSRRERVIGRTTVELGHWPNEQARAEYLRTLPRSIDQQCMKLHGGKDCHVRLHSRVLTSGAEPMLLVHLIDIGAEVEAERARRDSEVALMEANRELQQQVELHGAIEILARVGHWTNTRSDQEVIWSPGLYDIAGVAPRPAIDRSEGRGGIHPEDLPAWLAAREARDGRVVEFRWQRPDGQICWMRTRISRTEVAGNPQTDFGVVHDITAERAARQAQTAQLGFIHNITARVPGLMYQVHVSAEGAVAFQYINDVARDMLELEPEALRGDAQLLLQRLHADDLLAFRQSIRSATVQLIPWRLEFRVVLPRRGLRWFRGEGLPQREADGGTMWHGYVSDVTDTRSADQALERQHRMLDAVRQAQAAFIETDDKRQSFEGLLAALLTVTGSAYGFVGEVLYDGHDRPYLKTHAITNIAWDEKSHRMFNEQADKGMEFRNLKTLFGCAMATGQTVIANDPEHDERAAGLPKGHPPMTAFLGVPIAVGDRLVAMVGLSNQPGGYSLADVEFLQPLLGTVRQLVLAWRSHAERQRSRLQLQATGALLAEKSAALQVTFDSMAQGLTMVDAGGRIRFYNRRMLELLDLPESVLSGQPDFTELVAFQRARGDFGDDMGLVEPQLRPYVGQEPRVMPPEVYLRKTRQGRVLEICTRMMAEGGMVRTYTDVSSYVEAQEALRDERQRLSWVLEATRPGIWESDLSTGKMTVNQRWAEMLGHQLDELSPLTRDSWRSRIHPDDLERVDALLQRHWSGETPYYECDVRMRHKGGHYVWVNSRGRVHQRDANGAVVFMSGTHIDIGERVAAEEEVRALNASLERRVAERTDELERSMKDMEAISYSIAHDLRAPLRAVNGFAALIGETEFDQLSEGGRDMFGRIARSSRNMGQMITDMLELLRVVRVEIEAVPVDMNALARSVAETLAPGVPHAVIRFLPMPQVMGDLVLLRQVLVNLLDNALKYSRHHGEPVVELGFDEERQAFYVRDNGMGFDMAHAHKLFGLFQRLHAGSEVPGTGVGLAIVARTLERHGGRIWAESKPGEGATFWWTLPRT